MTGQSQFNLDGTSKITKELIDKINKDLSFQKAPSLNKDINS